MLRFHIIIFVLNALSQFKMQKTADRYHELEDTWISYLLFLPTPATCRLAGKETYSLTNTLERLPPFWTRNSQPSQHIRL